MTLHAVLDALELCTPEPLRAAQFYGHALQCDVEVVSAEHVRCHGPGRRLQWRRGEANRLHASQFRFADAAALQAYAARFEGQAIARFDGADAQAALLTVTDPEGRLVRFCAAPTVPESASTPASAGGAAGARTVARLQHYAVRTPDPEALVRFYVDRLGFVASDFVRDDQGVLRAAFLRTDPEHHALAIFHAPAPRFDHFSCETRDWLHLRDWADHMARSDVPLVWGVGRHGPGNDTFFMVADPDGNLAEISCDLEVCPDERPAGVWPHRQSTLNRWGMAIMRS